MVTEVITVHGPLKQPNSGGLRKLPPSSGISYYCHDVYMLIFPFFGNADHSIMVCSEEIV